MCRWIFDAGSNNWGISDAAVCENEGRLELFKVTYSAPLSPNALAQLDAWHYSRDPKVTCADDACRAAVPRMVGRLYDDFVDAIKPLLLLQVGAAGGGPVPQRREGLSTQHSHQAWWRRLASARESALPISDHYVAIAALPNGGSPPPKVRAVGSQAFQLDLAQTYSMKAAYDRVFYDQTVGGGGVNRARLRQPKPACMRSTQQACLSSSGRPPAGWCALLHDGRCPS